MAGDVADAHFDEHGMLDQVRKNLRVVNPNSSGIVQLNPANDAIPTSAQRIRNTVRIGSIGHQQAIVHANREAMPAGRNWTEIVNVRRDETHLRPYRSLVKPDRSRPMWPF